MSFYDEILQPLRFYTDVTQRAFTKRPYSDVIDRVQLVCDKDRLIPFLLTRTDLTNNPLTSVLLVDKLTGVNTDITSEFSELIDIKHSDTIEYLRYFADSNFGSSLSYGTYSLTITDGVTTWYSEYFKIKPLTDSIKFEFWNSRDVGSIIYQNDFKLHFYIEAFISDSGKYQAYNEEIENKNKDIYKTFQRKDKVWEVNFYANSYLYDAIQLMDMHDNIWIYDRDSTSAEIEITDISAEKIVKTDYLSVKVEFRVIDNKVLIGANDSNTIVNAYVTESGIYRGKKRLYRGDKKIVR